jgi:hypothetical protein
MAKRIAIAAFFGVLLTLSTLHLLTGLADNGDFGRDICPFMTRPVGFSAYEPTDPAERERRFVHHWYDRWELKPGIYDYHHICQGSSHQILVFGEVLLSKLLLGTREFSLTLGSLLPRALFWLLFLAWCRYFHRLLDGSAWFLVPSALLWCLFNESVFAGLLNSFFEDLSGILWLCGLVLCLMRYLEHGRRRDLYLGGACLAVLTAAKTAYVLAPFVLLGCWAPLRRPRSELALVAGLCALALLAATPLITRDRNRYINAYHATYLGALTVVTPAERAALLQPAGPYDPACVGRNVWASDACWQRHRRMSHADAVRIYLTHPMATLRALEVLRREAVQVRIRLGMDRDGAPGYAQLPLFNVWARLLMPLLRACFYPLVLGALALLVLAGRRRWLPPALLFALWLTLGMSLSQYVTILADGLADFERHSLLANFALALFVVLATCAGLLALVRRLRRAPAHAS